MTLYVTLVFCVVGAVSVVARYDRYRPKPVSRRLVVFGIGVAAMSFAAHAEEWTFRVMGSMNSHSVYAVAAFEEELLKVCSLLVFGLLVRLQFDDPMEGIVYGSIAGLGMALEESIYYLGLLPAGSAFLPPQELVRLIAHLVMGGISGFGIGYALNRQHNWLWILVGSFSAATALHVGFDWIVLGVADAAQPAALGSLFAAALMLLGFLLYGVLVAAASEQSRALYDPGGPQRLWGWPFNQLTFFTMRRPSLIEERRLHGRREPVNSAK